MDGLTAGRIVHFVELGYPAQRSPDCQAAIVTDVIGDISANLHVFDFDGNGGSGHSAEYDEGKAAGTWHWPERA
jgi:hypothetical protein